MNAFVGTGSDGEAGEPSASNSGGSDVSSEEGEEGRSSRQRRLLGSGGRGGAKRGRDDAAEGKKMDAKAGKRGAGQQQPAAKRRRGVQQVEIEYEHEMEAPARQRH